MSKGPWKERKKKETVLNYGSTNELKNESPVISSPPPIIPNSERVQGPPPLPPLSASAPQGSPLPAGAAPKVDDGKLKAGLARAFCSTTKGLANGANYLLRNTAYSVEMVDIELVEGELWAEFALPVLRELMPNLEKNPVATLAVITGMILSGKIKIHNKGGNYGNTGNTETVATS